MQTTLLSWLSTVWLGVAVLVGGCLSADQIELVIISTTSTPSLKATNRWHKVYREGIPGPETGGHFVGRWAETSCDLDL
jgi:hypothetical protein